MIRYLIVILLFYWQNKVITNATSTSLWCELNFKEAKRVSVYSVVDLRLGKLEDWSTLCEHPLLQAESDFCQVKQNICVVDNFPFPLSISIKTCVRSFKQSLISIKMLRLKHSLRISTSAGWLRFLPSWTIMISVAWFSKTKMMLTKQKSHPIRQHKSKD